MNRLRRWAVRLGYQLKGSRAKRIHADDFCEWRLLDARGRIALGQKFDATLDEIERELQRIEDDLRGERK